MSPPARPTNVWNVELHAGPVNGLTRRAKSVIHRAKRGVGWCRDSNQICPCIRPLTVNLRMGLTRPRKRKIGSSGNRVGGNVHCRRWSPVAAWTAGTLRRTRATASAADCAGARRRCHPSHGPDGRRGAVRRKPPSRCPASHRPLPGVSSARSPRGVTYALPGRAVKVNVNVNIPRSPPGPYLPGQPPEQPPTVPLPGPVNMPCGPHPVP
jgi:hypothetical protein